MAYATLRRADHFERVEVAYASMEKDKKANEIVYVLKKREKRLGKLQTKYFAERYY